MKNIISLFLLLLITTGAQAQKKPYYFGAGNDSIIIKSSTLVNFAGIPYSNKSYSDSIYTAASTGAQSALYCFSDAQHNSEFIVDASMIPRPGGTVSHGQPVVWEILDYSSAHGNSFFTSITTNGSQQMVVHYPNAKYVFYCSANVDESYAQYGVFIGATVATNNAAFTASRPGVVGQRIRGNGSGTWTQEGGSAWLDITTFNTGDGSTKFNAQLATYINYDAVSITYQGPNNYGIQRFYSALGAYNIGFYLIDRATGNPVTTNPTTADEVVITPLGVSIAQINLQTFIEGQNTWMLSNFNWWIIGRFELWMFAKPATSTSNLVRWQTNFTGATNYKIYRDDEPTFTGATLIHTGTSGAYLDTGLTASTLYHYKEVAVVGGVDTDVTTYRCRTK